MKARKSYRKSVFVAGLTAVLPSCALDVPSNLSIHIPDMTTGSASSVSRSNFFSLQTGSGAYTMPTSYTGFTCYGVMVSGTNDLCWLPNGNQNTNNRGPIYGGLVPQSGGSIQLQVPVGGVRKVQLFGVMSDASPACPAANSIRNMSATQGTWNNSILYSEPALLDSTTISSFVTDQSVTLYPSKYVAGGQQASTVDGSCTGSSQTGPIPTSGLRLWLDSEKLPQLSDNAMMTTAWPDSSGNGMNATPMGTSVNLCSAGGTACVYGSTSLPNGKKVVNVTSGYLKTPADSYLNGTTGRTVIIVAMGNDSSAVTGYLYQELFSSGSAGTVSLFHNASAMNYTAQIMDSSPTARVSSVTLGSSVMWHVQVSVWSSVNGTIQHFYDGNAVPSASLGGLNPNPSGHNSIWIGSDNTGANNWNGNIAEVIVYNRELSSAEQTQVECFLRSKFNVNAGTWGHTCP